MQKYYGLIIIVCFMIFVLMLLFITYLNGIKLQEKQYKHEIEMQKNQHQHELEIQKLKGEIKYDIKFQESKKIRGISN
jgi:hypothetical protein